MDSNERERLRELAKLEYQERLRVIDWIIENEGRKPDQPNGASSADSASDHSAR